MVANAPTAPAAVRIAGTSALGNTGSASWRSRRRSNSPPARSASESSAAKNNPGGGAEQSGLDCGAHQQHRAQRSGKAAKDDRPASADQAFEIAARPRRKPGARLLEPRPALLRWRQPAVPVRPPLAVRSRQADWSRPPAMALPVPRPVGGWEPTTACCSKSTFSRSTSSVSASSVVAPFEQFDRPSPLQRHDESGDRHDRQRHESEHCAKRQNHFHAQSIPG